MDNSGYDENPSKRMKMTCPTFDDEVGMEKAKAFYTKYVAGNVDAKEDVDDLRNICSNDITGGKRRKNGKRGKRGGNNVAIKAIRDWLNGITQTTPAGFSNYITGAIYIVLLKIVYDVSQSSPFAATVGTGFELWRTGQCATFSSLILTRLGLSPFCDIANHLTELVVKALIGNPVAISALIGIATTTTLTPVLVHKLITIISKTIVGSVISRTNLIQDATAVNDATIAAMESTPEQRRNMVAPLINQAIPQGDLTQEEAAEILAALNPRTRSASLGGVRRKTRRGARKTGRGSKTGGKSRKTRSNRKRKTRRH